MKDTGLTRRKLLAGVAAAGGSGATAGVGTASLFNERGLFGENTIAAGALDMEVTLGGSTSPSESAIKIDFSEAPRQGSKDITIGLPPGENNPAYLWVGAVSCPDGGAIGHALTLTLRYRDCGTGNDGDLIGTGDSLEEFASDLVKGVPLDASQTGGSHPGEQSCLTPDSEICLRLDWALAEDYSGDESVPLEFEFVGRQCRHADGTDNPFDEAPQSCDDDSIDGLSWFAFCPSAGNTLDHSQFSFTIDDHTVDLQDGPATLETVVLKHSTELWVFDDPDPQGEFTTLGESDYDQLANSFPPSERSNSCPCLNGNLGLKYDIVDGQATLDSLECSND